MVEQYIILRYNTYTPRIIDKAPLASIIQVIRELLITHTVKD